MAPKEIVFDNVPKTRSGKIMRRLLKARELGLPEGDISTLESEDHMSGSAIRQTDAVAARHALMLLRQMILIRRFEEKCCGSLQRRTKSTDSASLHRRRSGRGRRMQALERDDAMVATYREHGHALVRGVP